MDPANISWLDSDPDESYWEAHHRRSDLDGDCSECSSTRGRQANRSKDRSDELSKVSRYYEEIGDDLGRHERMAEAMYEC